MAPSFPGSQNALPGVNVQVDTISSGLSIPAGTRFAVLIGEGARRETIVASANGGGADGFNSTYTGINGQDGRHFLLSNAPIIENRTSLYKNGILLAGTEDVVDSTTFSSAYDYRVDPATGEIELQTASLVDQGGAYYTASSLNVGNGTVGNLTLVDVNAPTETWSIRVSSILRDSLGNPIDGYARFVATGSVSGSPLDGYGNVVIWQSNGTVVSNGILSFSISEGTTSFREGDRFIVEVKGGVLLSGDSLTANYIATIDINDPEFFVDFDVLQQKHGAPSTSNTLSLGAQLAFANGTPGLYALQAAPSIPRRVSYIIKESSSGEADPEDLTFSLPLGVVPDADSNINFFITNPITEIESQLVPNKVAFYDATITSNPDTNFIQNAIFSFSYTVIIDTNTAVVKFDNDGVITYVDATHATFSSVGQNFGQDDINGTRSVYIYNATNPDNNGTFAITGVSAGVLTISRVSGTFVNETGLDFEVIDSIESGAKILFTTDLAAQLPAGTLIRASVVDERDSDFFDAGWISAYEALETLDIDIVVPLPRQTISAIFQNGAAHVRYMSNIKNSKERVLFIGAIAGLTPANVIGTEDAAVEDIGVLEGIQGDTVLEVLAGEVEDLANYDVQNAYGTTYRVVYFYPDEIIVQIGADNTTIDGFYIAAAAAGYLSGVTNIAMPLTRKTLTGFTILREKTYRPVILENLTAAGITVLQPITGGGKVIRGQTTTSSGYVEEREISIIFIRDSISKQLRSGFDEYIGQTDSPVFESALQARGQALMASFINQGLITNWKDMKITRDTVDPTQWNITVKVQPTYPVNFIYIRVSIGLLE
jgi:hypothetical protein